MLKKFLLTAAAVGVLASGGSAETFVLSNYKHWSVSYVENDNSEVCIANVNNGEGLGFNLGVAPAYFGISIVDPRIRPGGDLNFDMEIDRMGRWKIDSAQVRSGNVYADLSHASSSFKAGLVDEISRGAYIYFRERGAPRKDWRYKFSLRGSRVAVDELLKCSKRLGTW
tara:strand:+ start:1298 stop:1804 length:507 start_codon:yes stop_codon:yes gene_type:complete